MKEIWPLSETMNHNMNFSAAGTISFQLTGGTNRYSGVDNDPETRNPRITYPLCGKANHNYLGI
jgi:hypothetical protein